MITPLDIKNKKFKKALVGYNRNNVDEYLDDVIQDYELLYKENMELKDKINFLMQQINQYEQLEENLKKTLIVAQTTAEEMKTTAREKADIITREAQVDKDNILNAAEKEVREIKAKHDMLLEEAYIFKTRYKSFMESQLMSLDDFYESIENKKD